MTDYACPYCRRVRRRAKRSVFMTFKCSCVGGELIECPRVMWELADWTLLDQRLADALGVGVHVVRAKRAKLRRKPGTVGRKVHVKPKRRIDASKINPSLSRKENARLLKCTPERIRQLLCELNRPE